MNNLFLRDLETGQQITWEKLIQDINITSTYNPYCNTTDYYTVFKHIILSILIDEDIILLDPDFTESELINLTGYSDYNKFSKYTDKFKSSNIADQTELIKKLNTSAKTWRLTLFTSGTTGIPKKVSHSFTSITRFVKISEHNKNNIWGFAYNPTHMAGIQVFFQAVLNENSIVRLFGLDNANIYNEIITHKITHISATPTFYKLLLPCNKTFTTVKRITSGGEKFVEKIFQQLLEVFPNAKITNVYASTEAGTLFASENDIFDIQSEFENLIRIENNELIIHSSLMAKSETMTDEWYKTGDLVEIIPENPLKFRFVSRKNDMINVGGYKVNPHEVEEAVLTMEGIDQVRVYSKSNSVLGNIICCEIVSKNKQISELTVRTFLQSKLQEFKIPRIIKFSDRLSTTRTGKLKRN